MEYESDCDRSESYANLPHELCILLEDLTDIGIKRMVGEWNG